MSSTNEQTVIYLCLCQACGARLRHPQEIDTKFCGGCWNALEMSCCPECGVIVGADQTPMPPLCEACFRKIDRNRHPHH
jgi:hypothetical protein